MFSQSNRKEDTCKTPTNHHSLIYLENFEKYLSAENILKTMSHQTICNIYSPILYPTLHKKKKWNPFQVYAYFQCNHVRNRITNILTFRFEQYTLINTRT
jgi:hypothetical protein